MNAAELRGKAPAELRERLRELYREQMNLRIQRATGQLANTARFKAVRRDIARIQTVMTEQRRTGA
jgi:large subunit ribosomal protein L29